MIMKSRVGRSLIGLTAVIAVVASVALFGVLAGGDSPAKAEPQKDVPFGFWVSDSASIGDALRQVGARAGFVPEAPPAGPAGFELRSVAMRGAATVDPLRTIVLDYFGKGFAPPTAGPVDANVPHIQVAIMNAEATEGRPSTAIDLGVAGYTAITVDLSASESAAAGHGGIYVISGHGRSWTVTVFAPGAPKRDALLPFFRALVGA
jgi:hypothetical protein